MWIVRIALRRPYTFVVLALLVLMVGPLTIARTPTDIFPNIDIPVITTVWNYGGLSAEEMSNRIVSIYERNLTTTVNDIEHVESQSLRGIAVVKVFFQPGAKIDLAVAQVTASAQSNLRQLPPGTQQIGPTEYDVDINASPRTIEELNDLPIRTVGGATIYIRDVAHVRNGFPPQTNIVRVNGSRAALLTIQKVGSASTLDIIDNIKSALPRIEAGLPQEL